MDCPTCRVELKITDRQGVEIDYCPRCRGVWLDRGELDKIIERSAHISGPDRELHERSRDEEGRQPYHGRKKRSFLGDMFEFD